MLCPVPQRVFYAQSISMEGDNMRKFRILLLAAAMLFTLAACGQKKAEPEKVGGWTLNDSFAISAEAQQAFDKAMDGLVGVNYQPIGLLGTQLVSGTNYSFLCEAAVVYPNAQPYYAVVTVYADLQGKAEVRNIVALDLGKIAESGAVENAEAAGQQLLGGWTVDRESSVELDGAVQHLASQVVAGKNHCVLCKGWTLSFVYENLEGKTEVTKTVPLDIAELSQPKEA